MKKPNFGRQASRHPAVIDLLGGAPNTPSGAANTAAPDGPAGQGPRSTKKLALAGAGLAAALIVGAVWATSGNGGDQPATAAAAATATSDEDTLPILDLPETTAPTTTASSDVDDECRADRGDQNNGAGVIAAWNHAYYIQRNAAAARALATPNSSVVAADQLQPFIDGVPIGTNYCLRTKALSEDVYLVDLSELRPEGAQRITQTVTTKKIDGKWFVDVFN